MPRGGSKKGEHRGNAKRRPETVGDIMRDVLSNEPGVHTVTRNKRVKQVDARMTVARKIYGATGDVRDMTPREVMLNNMHYFMQGAFDWQDHLMTVVEMPVSEESAKAVELAQGQIERYRNLASEDAYKVAPYIHPRLAAVMTSNTGENPHDVVQALLDDIDARQRDQRVIEHVTAKKEDAA